MVTAKLKSQQDLNISIWLAELFVIDWTISSSMHLRCLMFGFLSEPDLCNFRFLMQSYALASGACHQNWSLEATISPHRGQRASGSENRGGAPFIFQPHGALQVNTTRIQYLEFDIQYLVFVTVNTIRIQWLIFSVQNLISSIWYLISRILCPIFGSWYFRILPPVRSWKKL